MAASHLRTRYELVLLAGEPGHQVLATDSLTFIAGEEDLPIVRLNVAVASCTSREAAEAALRLLESG